MPGMTTTTTKVLFVLTLTSFIVWSDAFVPVLLDDDHSTNASSDLHRLAYEHVLPSLNCSEDEYIIHKEFTILDNGSLLLTDDDEPHEPGTFIVRNGTALLCPDDDESMNFTKEFLSCSKVLVKPHDMEVLDNGHVHVPVYSRTYRPGEFLTVKNGVYVCFPTRNILPSLNCSEDVYTIHEEFTILDNGSLLLSDDDEPHEPGTFIVRNGTALLCPDDDESYNFTKEFLSCAKVLVEPHEVEVLDNGHVHVPVYSRTYPPGEFFKVDNGVYVCFPTRNGSDAYTQRKDKFSDAMNVVTYVGLSVSILSLLCHLGVFCALPTVRNLPGCCLASLSLSLLVAYACFLAAGFVESDADCTPLGLSVYYFFLTSFFWMNAIAFDVWRSFRVVIRELRISSHRVPWRRFLLYSLYSWSVPAVLTTAVKILDTSDLLPEDYRPSFGDEYCWFGQRKALFIFFAAPLMAVMVLNAAFFLDVTFVISRAQLKTSAHEATALRKRFFMFTRLGLIMGLTWIVGLVAAYANSAVLWYMFVLLNTLQGLFIFAVFSCSSKVRGLFCKRYRKKQGGSTSVRTISQISAAV